MLSIRPPIDAPGSDFRARVPRYRAAHRLRRSFVEDSTRQGIIIGGFDGKVALITGAASGIGRAITLRLSAEGASVLAADIDRTGLAETAAKAPGRVIPHDVDVGDPEACKEAVASCVEEFSRLDVLGNVAGIFLAAHTTDTTVEQYRRVIAVNMDGPLFLSQAAIPHLLESGGTIVNIASNSGIQGVPYATAYGMSKGGVLQLTKSLAVEYIKTPIRVNAIAPAGCKAPSITGAVYTIVNGMTVS